MRTRPGVTVAIPVLAAMLFVRSMEPAVSRAAVQPEIAPVKDRRAMAELKAMGDALSSAKTLTFDTTSMTPIRGPNGQWVHILSSSKVSLKRPDSVMVETGGDELEKRITFDGKIYSVSVPEHHLYSQTEMPGTIDSMLAQAAKKGGNVFTFADVLLNHPYESWSKSLEGAVYVGQSTRGREKLTHIALTSKTVDWEAWLDVKSHLPRIVYVKYTGVERTPSVMIEFSKWKVNPPLPSSTFAFSAPIGAARAEFKAPGGDQK